MQLAQRLDVLKRHRQLLAPHSNASQESLVRRLPSPLHLGVVVGSFGNLSLNPYIINIDDHTVTFMAIDE